MAKTKSKVRRYSALIHTVLSFILVISGIILLGMVISKESELSKIKKNNREIENVIAQVNQNIDDYQLKLSEIETLKSEIDEIKSTYFKNAVELETRARNKEGDYKVAFMTFDDGPYRLTEKYLDCLKEYDVQATFFLLKKDDEIYDDIYKRYKSECHTIGNHTASHKFRSIYSSEDAFIEDLKENRDFIEEKLGYTTEVMRFPGGSAQCSYEGVSRSNIAEKMSEIHYGYVDWNCMTGDGESGVKSSDYYYHRLISSVTEDDRLLVILMHDYSENTLVALPDIIEELQRQGFVFLPLCYDSPTVKKQ